MDQTSWQNGYLRSSRISNIRLLPCMFRPSTKPEILLFGIRPGPARFPYLRCKQSLFSTFMENSLIRLIWPLVWPPWRLQTYIHTYYKHIVIKKCAKCFQVGFITYDRTLQFYMIPEGASQASQLIVGRYCMSHILCQCWGSGFWQNSVPELCTSNEGRFLDNVKNKTCSNIFAGDIDDIFLPSPSDLLINLQSCKEQVT